MLEVKKTSDYPFEDRTKKPYFVEIKEDEMSFFEGFDTIQQGEEFIKNYKK